MRRILLLFKELNLVEPIQKALESEGYTKPTPIQEQAIPKLLQGKDLLGCAQTGTGKTAAFALPILQNLASKKPLKKEKRQIRSEEHTSELQSRGHLVCRLLLEKKKNTFT